MLVPHIAAVRDSVVFVLRVKKDPSGTVQVVPAGTACYLGNDTFLTAAHLFQAPPLAADELIQVGAVPGNGQRAIIFGPLATIDYISATPDPDLALLRVPDFGATLPARSVSVAGEPDGRSVFSYGFITPAFTFSANGPMMVAHSRACASIIASRPPMFGGRYELDGHTYPGESGAPVFRSADHVVIGVVQASRLVAVPPPHGTVRGPTIAGTLAPIAGELALRGIAAVP
ncbi:MAG: serine protease [Polyangiaceae bacterium]